MQYTKDNILNLRFRRGGTAEYLLKNVYKFEVQMKHLPNGRCYFMGLEQALIYFNNGKWKVVEVPIENVYQIF